MTYLFANNDFQMNYYFESIVSVQREIEEEKRCASHDFCINREKVL